jgi:uncharacterized protein
MRFLPDTTSGEVLIGLAISPFSVGFIERHPGLVDYLEVPFELLRHNPAVAAVQALAPVILHCASLSVAGFVPPTDETLDAVAMQARRTRTPWIGEHLAFTSADPLDEGRDPVLLGYTVCPQWSEESLERVCDNLVRLQAHLPNPLVLENPPQYFPIPGSTLSMTDFIRELYQRHNINFLLDLTHFLISSINIGFDARDELERLPLERVVEIHISGLNLQAGIAWDDHARVAGEPVFKLLFQVLRRVRPRALTLEYNWMAELADDVLKKQIDRARDVLART